MAITAANRVPEVNIILDHHSRAERDSVVAAEQRGAKIKKALRSTPSKLKSSA
jgi:hypothetical protein